MAKPTTIFKRGDKVRYNKEAFEIRQDRTQGVLMVTNTIDVPLQSLTSVGHPQWVRLSDRSLISGMLVDLVTDG